MTLPLSYAERFYLYLHRQNFARRQARQQRFADQYIISVGNLSAGGSGKTPTCALLLQHLHRKKQAALLVLRGYKARLSRYNAAVLVSSGYHLYHTDARQAGDEALLLAQFLRNMPRTTRAPINIAIARKRADAIQRYAPSQNGYVILDDAFQNPSVYRDHDLVLIDATLPLAQMRLFPYGRMREPLRALARANTVLLTRCDQAKAAELRALKGAILQHFPHPQAIFQSSHQASGLRPILIPSTHTENPAQLLDIKAKALIKPTQLKRAKHWRRRRIGAFCGIANPNAFFTTLRALGLQLNNNDTYAFADHHFFSLKELQEFFYTGPAHWVTTTKDLARLNPASLQKLLTLPPASKLSQPPQLFVLEISIQIQGRRQQEFLQRVLG